QSGTPLFTTAFYMIADLAENRAYYSNAGHPKPMVLHRESGTVDLLDHCQNKSCPALGLFDDSKYTTASIPLRDNDSFVFFTDGVYDVEKDGELLSPEWLRGELQKRSKIPLPTAFDEILSELQSYSSA